MVVNCPLGRTHVLQPILTYGCLLMYRLKEWQQILGRTWIASFLKFCVVYWIRTHCPEHRCLPWSFFLQIFVSITFFLNWAFVPILKQSLISFMLFSVFFTLLHILHTVSAWLLAYRVSLTACVANFSFHVIKLQHYHIAYSWAWIWTCSAITSLTLQFSNMD